MIRLEDIGPDAGPIYPRIEMYGIYICVQCKDTIMLDGHAVIGHVWEGINEIGMVFICDDCAAEHKVENGEA